MFSGGGLRFVVGRQHDELESLPIGHGFVRPEISVRIAVDDLSVAELRHILIAPDGGSHITVALQTAHDAKAQPAACNGLVGAVVRHIRNLYRALKPLGGVKAEVTDPSAAGVDGIGILGVGRGLGVAGTNVDCPLGGIGQFQKLNAEQRSLGGHSGGHRAVDRGGWEGHGGIHWGGSVNILHCHAVDADEDAALCRAVVGAVRGEGNSHAVVGAAGNVGQLTQRVLAGAGGAEVQQLIVAVG
ncbi:hypothetical protein SDC9_148061 [bioreactor metagenome]|uniref:Uncharacterized protein n=1 Tax=bioreactor metagenome TaxID=1076179 RepID=A0A645EJX7_9ZZZZ